MIYLAISFTCFGIVIGISGTMLCWIYENKKNQETIRLYSKYLKKFSGFIVEQRLLIKKLKKELRNK